MWKKVEAILRPYQIQSLIDQFNELNLFFYLEDCKGFGKRLSPISLYRPEGFGALETLPKTKITLLVHEKDLQTVYQLILKKGDDGISGNGKIFIEPILKIIDIQSREIDE